MKFALFFAILFSARAHKITRWKYHEKYAPPTTFYYNIGIRYDGWQGFDLTLIFFILLPVVLVMLDSIPGTHSTG